MQLDERKKLIEDVTKEFLNKMGFDVTIYTATTVTPAETETGIINPISVEIQLNESKYLIGKHGVNLSALQHILRILVRKKAGEQINFNVDINGYRENQCQSIANLANEIAQKVFHEKKSVVLRSMNAYERRIVHVELADTEGIKTESMGEGEERRVIIKPASIKDE
ncbi:MAG: R3H domain-containing nucleic acid-binding protein [Patescibacteria group bacterium]|nr:R3H domain-containing nucleic acid-binding protein [Patescibacteria group bacterium]